MLRVQRAFLGLMLTLGLSACGSGEELPDDRPSSLVLVELTATDCGPCQEVHEAVQDTRDEYENRVQFVTFDMTNSGGRLDALQSAERFGGQVYVDRYAQSPGTVFLMDSANGELIMTWHSKTEATVYETALKTALEEKKDD